MSTEDSSASQGKGTDASASPSPARCRKCRQFLAREDQHDLCPHCRPCSSASPCPLDTHWTAVQWSEWTTKRDLSAQARLEKRKSKKPKKDTQGKPVVQSKGKTKGKSMKSGESAVEPGAVRAESKGSQESTDSVPPPPPPPPPSIHSPILINRTLIKLSLFALRSVESE